MLMSRISEIVTLEASNRGGGSKKLRCLLQRLNLKGCFGETENSLRNEGYPSLSRAFLIPPKKILKFRLGGQSCGATAARSLLIQPGRNG
jgi:hypothetical protein